MQTYSAHGFRNFILCLGYKAEIIKSYFLNYPAMNSDFSIALKTNDVTFHGFDHDEDWHVTLTDTGALTMTGARIARAAEKFLGNSQHMAVTYGDGLTDADLTRAFSFHLERDRIGTVLGVSPPSRFGELRLEHEKVVDFREKPDFDDSWINGGYFFFKRDILRYLSKEDSCVLEREPLVKLARDRQLSVCKHRGFWYAMDTQRDRDHLNKLWESGAPPWKVK